MKYFLSVIACFLSFELGALEQSQDIAIDIKINCPMSEEFMRFFQSVPPAGQYSSSFEEWKSSFINNMTQLIHLVDSGKIFNSSWSIRTEQQEGRWDKQLQDVKEIAKEAGKIILEIRNSGRLESKDVLLLNGKKVRQTIADLEGGQYIIEELSKRYPTYGLISQDQMDKDPKWYQKDAIWMINPIDGTKGFEKGQDDFHIQIGFLKGNESMLGVSYYPEKEMFVWAVKGQGAWLEKGEFKQKLVAIPCPEKILIKSSSYQAIESHFKTLKDYKIVDQELSSTSRLLKLIQGEASLYISLGASPLGTEKKGGVWNYGANAIIASEAGLILKTLSGHDLNLREPNALLTEGIFLTNDPMLFPKFSWDSNN